MRTRDHENRIDDGRREPPREGVTSLSHTLVSSPRLIVTVAILLALLALAETIDTRAPPAESAALPPARRPMMPIGRLPQPNLRPARPTGTFRGTGLDASHRARRSNDAIEPAEEIGRRHVDVARHHPSFGGWYRRVMPAQYQFRRVGL